MHTCQKKGASDVPMVMYPSNEKQKLHQDLQNRRRLTGMPERERRRLQRTGETPQPDPSPPPSDDEEAPDDYSDIKSFSARYRDDRGPASKGRWVSKQYFQEKPRPKVVAETTVVVSDLPDLESDEEEL
eukprot:NODE_3929_length_715_cov_42.951952_g3318_i0.p1 GENE.NODE_3929_length_715_cov_42.951952_g3318_i0~~NODE_3929_length_715_cov_42.951952_g3318_i0.p1  ORF type:complete len:129 (+),score=19.31 NODE_3929_length_715_cov_42.951952_g3318_i0:187-573(+)